MIDQVSLYNYKELTETLFNRRIVVFNIIANAKEPITSEQIMRKLGYNNPNKVRPRITELLREGLVRKATQVKVNGRLMWAYTRS